MNSAVPTLVTYEDRPAAFPGVELLARSLDDHAPSMTLEIHAPSAAVAELSRRLKDLPAVAFRETEALVGRGWNVKPAVLTEALEQHPRVLWLDTDIVVSGDLAEVLARFDPEALVVGQEFHVDGTHGGKVRAQAFGLALGRALPFHVNSGSTLVHRGHRALLAAWSDLLASADYQAEQAKLVTVRPHAMVGDQDALWALLVSEGFADLPVEYLRTGPDMLQHCGAAGYQPRDRFAVLGGAQPAFVHMLGQYKPWSFTDRPKVGSAAWSHWVAYELSPYFAAAQPYVTALGNPPWLRRRSLPARALHTLAFGNVALSGLPLAAAASLPRYLSRR